MMKEEINKVEGELKRSHDIKEKTKRKY
jgi:hypothetical protein